MAPDKRPGGTVPAHSAAPAPAQRDTRLVTDWTAACIMRLWGLPFPPARLAQRVSEALLAAETLGYPVALKAASPDVPHKTEVGAVRLGLIGPEEVAQAWDEIQAAVALSVPDVRLHGIMVQPMLPPGREMLVGALRDPSFGPLIMVGLGGIYTEVLRDTVTRMAPVTEAEALEMLAELRGYKILTGARGAAGIHLPDLSRAIATASRAVAEIGDVLELEMNPIICYPDRVVAVDGLIRLKD